MGQETLERGLGLSSKGEIRLNCCAALLPPPAAVDVEAAAASAAAAGFAERAVRTAFVRKVFFLVGLQLAITTGERKF